MAALGSSFAAAAKASFAPARSRRFQRRSPCASCAAAERVRAVYGAEDAQLRLESAEHLDGMLLLASWFRRFPAERARLWRPEEALARCGAAVSARSGHSGRPGAARGRAE